MSANQPPPYTANDAAKINLAHQPAESGSVSFGPQGGQAPLPQVPSAPPGYEAVTYYLASSSAGNAPIFLQPQPLQQQQPQVIFVQSPHMVVVPPVQQHVAQSFTAHIVLACCSCFCCFSCPFSIISFVLALVAQNNVSGSPNTARHLGTASLVLSIIGIVIAVLCWGCLVALAQ